MKNKQFHWVFLITNYSFWLVNILLQKPDTLSIKKKLGLLRYSWSTDYLKNCDLGKLQRDHTYPKLYSNMNKEIELLTSLSYYGRENAESNVKRRIECNFTWLYYVNITFILWTINICNERLFSCSRYFFTSYCVDTPTWGCWRIALFCCKATIFFTVRFIRTKRHTTICYNIFFMFSQLLMALT